MGVIKLRLRVRGDRGGQGLDVLFDSGASRSLVRSDVAVKLSTPRELLVRREFTAADGNTISCRYVSELAVDLPGGEVGVEAFHVDNLPVPLVFGALDMEAYRIKLDLPARRLDLSEFTGHMLAL